MAPRRKKKAGLTRMDAALDALRPMGYSPVLVRKCVKDLLKVYGDDGWRFIEEDAYRVLIDTVLEVPETPLLLENPDGGLKQAVSVPEQPLLLEGDPESSSKQLVYEESGVKFHGLPKVDDGTDSSSKQLVSVESEFKFHGLQTIDDGMNIKEEKLDCVVSPTPLKILDERICVKEEKLDDFVPSTSFKDMHVHPRVGRELGFAIAYNPSPIVGGKKNSNGWISDDE